MANNSGLKWALAIGFSSAAAVIVCMVVQLLRHVAQEKEAIQGTWKEVSVEIEGQSRPADNYWDFDSVYLDFVMRTRYHLNPQLHEIEWGPDWDKVAGIYELNGDRLKICVRRKKDGPVADFTTAPGDSKTLFILERVGRGTN
jgi:hypothetical protein